MIGTNSELIPNVAYENETVLNGTKCSYLPKPESDQDAEYVVRDSGSLNFNILGELFLKKLSECHILIKAFRTYLGNFYVSEGLPGKVLKVKTSKRKNEDVKAIDLHGNLISVMRKILNERYPPETPVSMGGVFLYRGSSQTKGKAKLHIMPEFSKVPLHSLEDVKNWLNFYEFNGPLCCLTAFHTANNYNLGLREEHTHCFGVDGNVAGGHYHYELDAKNADYEGYFNVAGEIVRVDQP